MTCPICKKQPVPAFRPFCSRRCADLDLGRWLNGSYAVPLVEEDGGEDWNAPPNEAEETRH